MISEEARAYLRGKIDALYQVEHVYFNKKSVVIYVDIIKELNKLRGEYKAISGKTYYGTDAENNTV